MYSCLKSPGGIVGSIVLKHCVEVLDSLRKSQCLCRYFCLCLCQYFCLCYFCLCFAEACCRSCNGRKHVPENTRYFFGTVRNVLTNVLIVANMKRSRHLYGQIRACSIVRHSQCRAASVSQDKSFSRTRTRIIIRQSSFGDPTGL